MENNSTFNIYKIGPRLAELKTLIEKERYFCKVSDYNAIVWDWNEQYPSYIDTIEGSCILLTNDKSLHPMYGENICLSYTFPNPEETKTMCIGMIDYEHPYKDYPKITDGTVTFYDYKDNDKKRLVRLPNEDLMYGYIDYVISYMKETEEEDLDVFELKNLLNEYYATLDLDRMLILTREKNE